MTLRAARNIARSMNVLSSWLVRCEGVGAEGDPAVMQTAVDAISATTAMALVMDRTRKLKWSDVKRIEITKRDK